MKGIINRISTIARESCGFWKNEEGISSIDRDDDNRFTFARPIPADAPALENIMEEV